MAAQRELKKPTSAIVGDQLVLSPTYVSNNNWCVPRTWMPVTHRTDDALKTLATRGVRIIEMDDENVARVIAKPASVTTWEVSAVRLAAGPCPKASVVLVTDGALAVIDARYADWLGLAPGDTVEGSPDGRGPFFLADGAVVMPLRFEALDLLRGIVGRADKKPEAVTA